MLTSQELAYLRSLPAADYRNWLNDIASENPALADELQEQVGRNRTEATKDDVADFFSISLETIDLWARKGMPYTKGPPNTYDLRVVASWLAAKRTISASDDVNDEYREEKRKLAELQRMRLEKTLVDRKWFEVRMASAIETIRKGMESIQRSFGDEVIVAITKVIDEAEEIVLGEHDDEELAID
jgi:hypothetical protein